MPYVVFAVERILESADLDSAEGKDRAIAELAPVMGRASESVVLDELRRRVAGALGIADTRLAALLAPSGADPGARGGPGGPPPLTDAFQTSPRRPLERVAVSRGDAEFGVKTERDYLAMCLAGGEAGRSELARIDPDALLTSAVLRRVVRRLAGQLELGTGDEGADAGDPAARDGISDADVSDAIDDLESRAARSDQTVGAGELEHARLLLELARVDRQLQRAKVVGEGLLNLATQRRMIQEAILALGAKLDRQQI